MGEGVGAAGAGAGVGAGTDGDVGSCFGWWSWPAMPSMRLETTGFIMGARRPARSPAIAIGYGETRCVSLAKVKDL